MITSVQGILQQISEEELVLEVGGVGLRIAIPMTVHRALPGIGNAYFLHTYLSVREDALNLYGFVSIEERALFELLLGVSGIGPRLALSVLSHLSAEMLKQAVANAQAEVLAQVPGIGRKTGEKIIFHLRDHFKAIEGEEITMSEMDPDVLGILTSLGYSLVEAQAAVQSIPDDVADGVEERVRAALGYFSNP